jgi:ADP-heptose:LPS heptosyltransferase
MTGRYLVRNPWLLAALGATDALLRLMPRGAVEPPLSPESILVSNWAHLGDVMSILPALQRLSRTYPGARLGVIVGGGGRAAVEGSSLVDALYVVDHWALNRGPGSLLEKLRRYRRQRRAVRAQMRADGGYEVALDFYPYFPSAAGLLKVSGARVRIGYDSGGLGPLLTHVLPWRFDGRHMIEHHADLLRVLDPATPDRLERLDPGRPAAPASPSLPFEGYMLLHTGAGSTEREWPAENWVALARRLAGGRPLVVAGVGEREARCAEAIVAAAPQTVNLVNQLSWSEFQAVVAGASLLVSLDSSPSHLAASLDVPVVAITSGRNAPGLWDPHTERGAVVTYPTACAPCFRPRGCESMACVRSVRVDDVLDAIRRIGIEP